MYDGGFDFGFNDVKDPSDSINFLLLGVDSLDSQNASNTRSDTIMLFNVNKSNGDISILSIPRDTRAPIEGRKYKEKINHSFVYGGPELTMDTVSNLLGIDLEYYVVVDYSAVEELVDIIGGVEVDVPMDMHYEDPAADPPLVINLNKGLQKLNGDESLQFLRFRKGYATADLGRIEAQQSFMKSLVKEVASPVNVIKIPKFYKIYNDNINTNIPFETIASYGLKFYKYDFDRVESRTLPGESKMINGRSFYVHQEISTEELVEEMFIDSGEYAFNIY